MIDKFAAFNPSKLTAHYIIRQGDDLTELVEDIKSLPVVGVTLDLSLMDCKLGDLFKQISDSLIELGKGQCTPEWIKEQMIANFLGTRQAEYTSLFKREVIKINRMVVIADLSDDQKCDFHTQVENWGRAKKLLK